MDEEYGIWSEFAEEELENNMPSKSKMFDYGISYVKRDKGPGSVDGMNLFVKYIKAWSEEHAEIRCRVKQENIRSIWRVA